MGPSPVELDEMLLSGLGAARWTWRHPFRRRRVVLPARAVRIGDQVWHAMRTETGAWACTPRQARQMRAALTSVLGRYEEPLENMIRMLTQDR